MESKANTVHREPWNKGEIVGQKALSAARYATDYAIMDFAARFCWLWRAIPAPSGPTFATGGLLMARCEQLPCGASPWMGFAIDRHLTEMMPV